MDNLIEKLRSSGNSLIDKVRGLSPEASNWRQNMPQNEPIMADLGIPENDLIEEIRGLREKGFNDEKIVKAIDSIPEIKDKEKAKSFIK